MKNGIFVRKFGCIMKGKIACLLLLVVCSCAKLGEDVEWDAPVQRNQIRYVLADDSEFLPNVGYWRQMGMPVESVAYDGRMGLVTFGDNIVEIPDVNLFGRDFAVVELPEGVKRIGGGTFKNSSIVQINLPESLEEIGTEAFKSCRLLEKISVPDNVANIGVYAFPECVALTEVEFPASLVAVEEGVFLGCTSLRRINIPESVKVLGMSAFRGCVNLVEVSLGSVTELGFAVFDCCSRIRTLIVPDSVEKIDGMAFYSCPLLTDVTIGRGIKEIGVNAFGDCRYLSGVTILASEPPLLDENAFLYSQIAGVLKIYVPAESVDLYKTSESFSPFADCIEAM